MPPKKKSTQSKNTKIIKAKLNENDTAKIKDTFKPIKSIQALRSKKTDKSKVVVVNEAIDIANYQEILKEFDLNSDFGPIIGIPRTARLNRAQYFNIPVKDEVVRILKDEKLLDAFPLLNLNIWHNIETLL